MVYRGKPSAGCENCRKAKKRCDLEQPACLRCVKLKKICTGYRDTTALQIQDESESVKRKSEKLQARVSSPHPPLQWQQQSPPPKLPAKITSNRLAPPTVTDTLAGIPTPGSINSDSTSSSDTIDLERDVLDSPWLPSVFDFSAVNSLFDPLNLPPVVITHPVMPKPDDIAATYFFTQFTSNNNWSFIRDFWTQGTMNPCLDLAIKACGMAALGNVEMIAGGKQYARSMYTVALGLLNDALRDPKQSKTDESLIAVAMLSRYENLTCDGEASIESWKAHIRGSTQLLKVRGKTQFKTVIGRMLFREMRAQAMIMAIWNDEYIPSFFREYEDALETYEQGGVFKPIDLLTTTCFDMADLRAKIREGKIAPIEAVQQTSELETRFIQWAIDCAGNDERWRYTEMDVADSEHVWDGKVFSFAGLTVTPTIWLTYFNMRIMLTRVQEGLCRHIHFSDKEREEQMHYYRRTRRQMTDDICATVPVALGHSSPAYTSPCVLVTAYGSLWPLFFAGTCALERTGPAAIPICRGEPTPPSQMYNKSAAQAQWILGRLSYISQRVGLKWADGVAATLKGDFMAAEHLLEEYVTWSQALIADETLTPHRDDKRPIHKLSKTKRAQWLRSRENSPQQADSPPEQTRLLSEALAKELAHEHIPSAWSMGSTKPYMQVQNAYDASYPTFGV